MRLLSGGMHAGNSCFVALVLAVGLWTPSASAAECPIRMRADLQPRDLPFDAGSSECLLAVSLEPDFSKLRAAAGIEAGSLDFQVDYDGGEVNAYYTQGFIRVTRAYLRADLKREARLATLAHEIGHAVQERDGLLSWMNEPINLYFKKRHGGLYKDRSYESSEEYKEYQLRSRKREAHADAIGQELLARAGYAPDTFTLGRSSRFGCQSVDEIDEHDPTHPADAQRYVNAAMTASAVSSAKAASAAQSIAGYLGGTRPSADAFTPGTSIRDYDDLGRLKPGRLAASKLSVPPPPPDAGVVRRTVQQAAASVVARWISEPFQAAVDGLAASERRSIARKVLASCGPLRSTEPVDFSVFGWIKRLSEDAALRAVGARKTQDIKSASLAIPG
ncbi:MAG: M48 family metalloprotease [Elusimicrobia bacterium]|nr:M48 family metalloprotease [Elusimicrobiota bacterium]